jgi:hypothetical protein
MALRLLIGILEKEGSRFVPGPAPHTLIMTSFEHERLDPHATWHAREEDVERLVEHFERQGAAAGFGDADEVSPLRAGLRALLSDVSSLLAARGADGAVVRLEPTRVVVTSVPRDEPRPEPDLEWRAHQPPP